MKNKLFVLILVLIAPRLGYCGVDVLAFGTEVETEYLGKYKGNSDWFAINLAEKTIGRAKLKYDAIDIERDPQRDEKGNLVERHEKRYVVTSDTKADLFIRGVTGLKVGKIKTMAYPKIKTMASPKSEVSVSSLTLSLGGKIALDSGQNYVFLSGKGEKNSYSVLKPRLYIFWNNKSVLIDEKFYNGEGSYVEWVGDLNNDSVPDVITYTADSHAGARVLYLSDSTGKKVRYLAVGILDEHYSGC